MSPATPPRHVVVLVLGDVGRSPRMQYHAVSLSKMPNTKVTLVGYEGERCVPQLLAQPNIHLRTFAPVKVSRSLFVLSGPLKVLIQLCQLFWILLFTLGSIDVLMVQNPPTIPTLCVAWLTCKLKRSKFVIDWHNFGYTVLALSIGESHAFVKIATTVERVFGQLADANFCVTKAMQGWLQNHWRIHATVLYDKPPEFFKPASIAEKHELFTRLADQLPAPWVVPSGNTTKPPKPMDTNATLLTTEIHSYVFNALYISLVLLDARIVDDPAYPDVLVVVTGKGPQKAMYLKKIQDMQLVRVHITTIVSWLEAADYPIMLGSADVGICLHTSTSGLDLPMKVLDMFGCQVPVCAVKFACLHELVRHNEYDSCYSFYVELCDQLQSLLIGFPKSATTIPSSWYLSAAASSCTMQAANFAPSMTPRPQKAAPSPRKARMLNHKAPSVSPIKVSASLSLSKHAPHEPMEEPALRPSKLKWDGDTHAVRNLQSHIHFGTTAVSGVGEIVLVFDGYGIHLTTDEAKNLLCEYEENNDLNLPYQEFVDNFALMLRSKESGKRHVIKKTRLTEHVKRLQTFQHGVIQEMNELLKLRLRDSWSTFRETLRGLDKDKSGFLSAEAFLKVLRKFNIPITMESLESLMLRYDANGDGIVNYAEFIAQFGASFSNYNAERVGNSILQHTAHDFSVAAVDEKEQSNFLRGQVRKLVDDKVAATWTNLRAAFLELDADKNGILTPDELKRMLMRFQIDLTDGQFQQLLACYDTNNDGQVNVVEFFNHFGEEIKFGDAVTPSSSPAKSKFVLAERTSLVMGEKVHQNDLPNIKEHFSRLEDATWHAMYLDFVDADLQKTGWIPRAQFLHILSMYMGELPNKNILSIFRSCGSHHNDLMNYRDLVKAYRPKVMGLYAPHPNKNTMNAPKQSPTEYLLMETSIREKRSQMEMGVWKMLKNEVIAADVKRIGRVTADCFTSIVKHHMHLRDEQIAFLCLFYEDKANTHHTCSIRYSSFLTDYDTAADDDGSLRGGGYIREDDEDDDVYIPPHMPPPQLRFGRPPDNSVKAAIRQHLSSIEAALLLADADLKGMIGRDEWVGILHDHHIKCDASQYDELFGRYTNASLQTLRYRELLLDIESGIQGKMVEGGGFGGLGGLSATSGGASTDIAGNGAIRTLDEAKAMLRHHLTSSASSQRRVYKYFSLVDTTKSGQLPYPEVRRVLEKIGLVFGDIDVFTAVMSYYDVDNTGMVPYLQLLHANGGKDPDKMTGLSDLASNCSYYSAISIAPKAVASGPRRAQLAKSHEMITQVINHHVEDGKAAVGGAIDAEDKMKALLAKRWKTILKMFQQLDTEKRGTISQASFKKVMDNVGLTLTFEDVLRICKKYDSDNSGRLQYHAFLKQHVQGKSTLSEFAPLKMDSKEVHNLPALSPRKSRVPDDVRGTLKQKWKSVYASLKKLDATNSGRLSPQHFRHLLEWFGITLTDDNYYMVRRRSFVNVVAHVLRIDSECQDAPFS
ncbi:hypothetical protein DYB37_000305 [Aphanomyces astaci]|uniref:EF-hand domain-containing protein n=1 Tax=Aphanomyces astaci TaxID=112090 RepID=A0A3R6XUS2_APHAT|nr:hypothetical protein DYB37_000305 [Aphanomyces astaci]